MTSVSAVLALLERADARVITFDPQGGMSVPMPEEWANVAAEALGGESPLDMVETASQGHAVAAFERARRYGHGTTSVSVVGETERGWLEIFDLEENHGCFVAIVTPETASSTVDRNAGLLTPRRAGYDLNVTGVIQAVSPEFCQMFGWREQDVIDHSSLDFIHPDDHENGIVNWIELLERPSGQVRLRQRLKTSSGDWLWCELTETNLLDDQDVSCVRSEIVDVSREMKAQAALQQREQLLDRLTKALPGGVMQLTADGDVSVQTERWVELVGPSKEPGLAGLLSRLIEPDRVQAAITRACSKGADADVSVTFADGAVCRFGELHIRPLQEADNNGGLLLTLDDVTKLQTYQMELAEQTRRDPLTGALNRLGVEQVLNDRLWAKANDADLADDGHIAGDRGSTNGLTVLFIDLDRFKAINDELGHVVGDQVLRAVTNGIAGCLRTDDQLGRVGGDEFLIILGPDTTPDVVNAIVSRIEKALPALADEFDEPIEIGASIGIASAKGSDGFDSLIKRADADMYEAKRKRAVSSTAETADSFN